MITAVAPTPEGDVHGAPVVVTLGAPDGKTLDMNTGVPDEHGVEWWATAVEGWEAPDVTPVSLPRVGRHGVWVAPSWFRARMVNLKGVLVAPTLADAQRARAYLVALANFTVSTGKLVVWEAEPTVIEVRLAGRIKTDWDKSFGKHVEFEIPLLAADPRRYSFEEQSLTFGTVVTPPDSEGGGFELPLSFPFDFGMAEGTITGGSVAEVGGTITTPPKFKFRGPCTAPAITNQTTAQTWRYTGSLAAGETLDVDVDTALVLLNGTANRYWLVDQSSVWWLLQPGTNVLSYTAEGTGSGDVTVTWRDAWL